MLSVKSMLLMADKVVRVMSKREPERMLTINGESASLKELSEKLHKFCLWVEPVGTFQSSDIEHVCRCKDCEWYRKFKQKGVKGSKLQIIRMCKLNMRQRNPDFYCADGIPRRGEIEKP